MSLSKDLIISIFLRLFIFSLPLLLMSTSTEPTKFKPSEKLSIDCDSGWELRNFL